MAENKDPRMVAADEVEFRTTVLVQLGEIGRDITHMRGSMEETKKALAEHVEHDNDRFGKVDQRIGRNESGISKGTGILVGVLALLGLAMWLIDKVRP